MAPTRFLMGLNLSLGLELESGAPLTAFAAHPVYDSGGEIPLTMRGAGFQTSNGFRTRTPWTKPVNAGASYNVKIGSSNLRSSPMRSMSSTRRRTSNTTASPSSIRRAEPGLRRGRRVGVVSGQQLATPRQFRVGVRYEF